MDDPTPCQLVQANSWREAKDELFKVPGRWVFRGQADTRWNLASSLERVSGGQFLSHLEKLTLREFRRRVHHYLAVDREHTSDLEWLALMQHHGAPTRLLDWTTSPYIAAYFALEDAHDICAVWAIDTTFFLVDGVRAIKRWKFPDIDVPGQLSNSRYHDAVLEAGVPGVFPVEPFYMNDRLTAQKGLFLLPGNSEMTFQKNLDACGRDIVASHVVKIEIPLSARFDGLMDLLNMNISRATLFPGVDGFAQSLRHTIENEVWMQNRARAHQV